MKGKRKKQAEMVKAFCDRNQGKVFTRSELIKLLGYSNNTYLEDLRVLWRRLEPVPNPRYCRYKII